MSTLPGECPGLPNTAVVDVREPHEFECVIAVTILAPSHTHVTVDANDTRAAATGRHSRRSRRRRARRRPALRGAFPRIVAADAAQVGEDPVDDRDVLDHGDTFHLDATLGAEQRVDLEDPTKETRPTPTPRPRGGGVVPVFGVGADLGERRTTAAFSALPPGAIAART